MSGLHFCQQPFLSLELVLGSDDGFFKLLHQGFSAIPASISIVDSQRGLKRGRCGVFTNWLLFKRKTSILSWVRLLQLLQIMTGNPHLFTTLPQLEEPEMCLQSCHPIPSICNIFPSLTRPGSLS